MADVGVPEHRVARHDLRYRDQARDEIGVPLGADPERTAWGRAAKIGLAHVILKRAKEHVGYSLRDRNQAQSAVLWSLACQCRPALIGAKHTAHRRRRNLAGFQPMHGVKRVVTAQSPLKMFSYTCW